MTPSSRAWSVLVYVGALLWGGQSFAATAAADVDDAMTTAESSLAEATKLDSVWAIWEPAVPADEDAPSLDEILAVAKEKQQAGELDEALRLARLVDFYAQQGIAQARTNATAGVRSYQ
jgi:hypothetical protein